MINGMNINDSIHGLIRLTEYEKRILSSPQFNRLHDVYQNSTVYLTYPCNRTKRFEHSIGCMYLCSEMFYYGCLNASGNDLDKFFRDLGEDIRQSFYDGDFDVEKIAGIVPWLMVRTKSNLIKADNSEQDMARQPINGEIDELYKQILNKVGEDLIPHNIHEKYWLLYVLLIQAVRIAALLHDIGHPPFSHIVEHALNKTCDIISTSPEKFDDSKKKKFLDSINPLNQNNEQLHEAMGRRIANDILQQLVTNNSGGAYDNRAKDSLFEQLLKQCVNAILADQGNFKVLHRIIDATVDGDRLDYVVRDYRNSGIDAGNLEYKRIITGLKLMWVDKIGSFKFLVAAKTKNTIENFLKRRFNLYKDIINHHRVIKTDMLLEDVVFKLTVKYLKEPEVAQDETGISIPENISGLWLCLDNLTLQGRLSLLTQWNDSWLMVILRKIYYMSYFGKQFQQEEEKILAQELTELLRNEKQYYSFIKRREDFDIINEGIVSVLKQQEDLIDRITDLEQSNSDSEKDQVKKSEGKIVVPAISLKIFLQMFNEHSENILSFFYQNISAFKYSETQFNDDIKDICIEVCNEEFIDAKPVFKKLKDGISAGDKDVGFYSGENYYTLGDLSNIQKVLGLESDSAPLFYLYVIPKDVTDINIKKKGILIKIGIAIGKKLIEITNSVLEEVQDA